MQPVLAESIPLAIMGLAFLGLAALLRYRTWIARKTGRKNPLTSDLLRGPGESLREKIDDMTIDIVIYMVMLTTIPILAYSMALSIQVFAKTLDAPMKVFFVLLGLISTVYFMVKVSRILSVRHKYRLGLDAETATGQELNHLMRDGFWVFHDFPADDFNIDHVVIGATGVFAVETKGRAKPTEKKGADSSKVTYDGMWLQFPNWKEKKPIEQADRQAEWLQKWLSDAVGESVKTQPVLALPGWYINSEKKGRVAVINGKNSKNYFLKAGNGQLLPETLINRIVFSVEQRCRDVQPKAYRLEDD